MERSYEERLVEFVPAPAGWVLWTAWPGGALRQPLIGWVTVQGYQVDANTGEHAEPDGGRDVKPGWMEGGVIAWSDDPGRGAVTVRVLTVEQDAEEDFNAWGAQETARAKVIERLWEAWAEGQREVASR